MGKRFFGSLFPFNTCWDIIPHQAKGWGGANPRSSASGLHPPGHGALLIPVLATTAPVSPFTEHEHLKRQRSHGEAVR